VSCPEVLDGYVDLSRSGLVDTVGGVCCCSAGDAGGEAMERADAVGVAEADEASSQLLSRTMNKPGVRRHRPHRHPRPSHSPP